MGRWDGVFLKTVTSFCGSQFIRLRSEHFTYFPTCTPNSSPVSPILLLSLAFMFFPHRWVERAPGGVMVKKQYERGESGRQTRPGNDRSWADATCLLHLLQSALRTNEILIGQQIIARVKTHCTDADLTIDYLPPRWPDSLRLSKLKVDRHLEKGWLIFSDMYSYSKYCSIVHIWRHGKDCKLQKLPPSRLIIPWCRIIFPKMSKKQTCQWRLMHINGLLRSQYSVLYFAWEYHHKLKVSQTPQ